MMCLYYFLQLAIEKQIQSGQVETRSHIFCSCLTPNGILTISGTTFSWDFWHALNRPCPTSFFVKCMQKVETGKKMCAKNFRKMSSWSTWRSSINKKCTQEIFCTHSDNMKWWQVTTWQVWSDNIFIYPTKWISWYM